MPNSPLQADGRLGSLRSLVRQPLNGSIVGRRRENSMDPTFSKAQRRRVRELARIAYERDLSRELARLEGEFQRWRAREIDPFGLSEAIHRFHQGPARELFSKYDDSSPEWAVAHAIHRGIVSAEEAGLEALEALAKHLAFLREQGA